MNCHKSMHIDATSDDYATFMHPFGTIVPNLFLIPSISMGLSRIIYAMGYGLIGMRMAQNGVKVFSRKGKTTVKD